MTLRYSFNKDYIILLLISKGLTCYTHLKCNRGYEPACLDWSDICDGKVDCLDGNYDEEHCRQPELNKCKENEFIHDARLRNFDCINKSDKIERIANQNLFFGVTDGVFGHEDARCRTTFLTSSCDFQYSNQLIE
ncbi:unnamed protein product [Adineta steineri]|uniref:Uncharacterized protein n=1 Tax=Adineta steineri TaxID=433720 RepID=A0A816BN89_9BILA|nr:unnamed protein product [Adineta steineri]CAF1612948.1 unnamed protein product [Adineta steineri]